MTKRVWQPKDWQRNPMSIDTEKVQYWQNGIMMTGQMSQEDARKLVTEGKCYVITGQAIGKLGGKDDKKRVFRRRVGY